MSEKLSRSEAAKMLHITGNEMAKLCKKHLTYKEDYFMHRIDGTRITVEAVHKLKEIVHPPTPIFDELPGDEVIEAHITAHLPQNSRMAFINVPGKEGRFICNIPPRHAKMFRVARRKIYVRHVGDDVYQLVIPRWNDA